LNAISSRQNPFVQRCRALARHRDAAGGTILLDGFHLLADALAAGVPVEAAVATAAAWASADGASLAERLDASGAQLYEATDAVLQAASPVRSPTGVVAVGRWQLSGLDEALTPAPALIVCVVQIQDPGNVGAIVRAADAAGATSVVVAAGSADPLGWKALRGSMGSAFRMPIAAAPDAAAVCAAARTRAIRVMATAPADGASLYDVDLAGPVMLLVGGEGAGLPAAIRALADEGLRVPMRAPVESLNVAVATGVILFEAQRQRRSRTHP
jgi:TrmH family RNA methyltransferase